MIIDIIILLWSINARQLGGVARVDLYWACCDEMVNDKVTATAPNAVRVHVPNHHVSVSYNNNSGSRYTTGTQCHGKSGLSLSPGFSVANSELKFIINTAENIIGRGLTTHLVASAGRRPTWWGLEGSTSSAVSGNWADNRTEGSSIWLASVTLPIEDSRFVRGASDTANNAN
jgi:hypothetical protein